MEVVWLRRKILIIGKSLVIGGKVSGKQLPNSHQKVQSLIIMYKTQEMPKVVLSLVNLQSGRKFWDLLILTLLEVTL